MANSANYKHSVNVQTPLGPFEAVLESSFNVAQFIEHVVSKKPLARGDIFEMFVAGEVVPMGTPLDALPEGDWEIIATGGAV